MIKNKWQYHTTKGWIQKFTQTLDNLEAKGGKSTPLSLLQQAEKEALAGQREALEREVRQSETLRARGQQPLEP